MAFDVASALQVAQPVTAFYQGRALQLAQERQVQQDQMQREAATRAQEEHDVNMKAADMKFGEQKAKQAYAASQQVLASDSPKALVEQQFPEFVQEYEKHGTSWAQVDDAHVKMLAQGVGAHAAAELGIAPAKPEEFTLKPGEKRFKGDKVIASVEQKPDEMTAYQKGQLKLEQDKFAFEKTKPTGADKPPAGYRWNDAGNLEFVPGGPADPSVATNQRTLRPIPAAAAQGIVGNRMAIKQIDRAIEAVKKNPAAFGAQNYAPDFLTQRLPGKEFSGGLDPRAQVADISSLKIHDRSGAAVTAAEFPRLKPFIPSSTDDAKTVLAKLSNLRANADLVREETESFYTPDAGYRSLSSGKSGPSVGTVQEGYRFKGGNPADPHSWEPVK